MFRVQKGLRAFLNPFYLNIGKKTGPLHIVSCNSPVLLFTQYIIYSVLQNSFR